VPCRVCWVAVGNDRAVGTCEVLNPASCWPSRGWEACPYPNDTGASTGCPAGSGEVGRLVVGLAWFAGSSDSVSSAVAMIAISVWRWSQCLAFVYTQNQPPTYQNV